MPALLRFGRICLINALMTPGLLSQTNTPPPQPQPATSTGASDRSAAAPTTSPVSQFPKYVPLTQGDRARVYFSHMFDVQSFLRTAAGAGINQWMNTPSEWHQGAEGYGRRFASIYGEHIIQSTVMYGFSAVLHEDNRYFQSGETGAGNRIGYALESTIVARRDDGSRKISVSRLTSYVVAASLSRLWQPRSTSGVVKGVNAFGVAVGVEAGFNVAREFMPRLFHARPPVEEVHH